MKEINDILMRELKRLDDNKLMQDSGSEEVARSNAISKAAQTALSIAKINLTIMNTAERTNKSVKEIKKQCGINE